MAEFDARPETDVVCHAERILQDGREIQVRRYGPLTSDMYASQLWDGCALFTIFSAALSPVAAAEKPLRSPEVTHTGKGPTGYTVTFRYANPVAKKVQIKGEWYFARPSELPQIAATPDHPVIEGQALLPNDWRPGDFPLQRPNSTGPNFPIADMTKDKDGVWAYTTPLPSGVFTYSFRVDCATPGPTPATGQAQCRPISDPSNRPWNEKDGVAVGSVALNSQVFVPSDLSFNSIDYGWQGPAQGPTKVKGKLTLADVAAWGRDGVGSDPGGYRTEFLTLVEQAQKIVQ